MKRDDLKKLRGEAKAELSEKLKSLRDKLWQLRLDIARGKVKNISEVRKTKKTIATINTLLKEK